MEIDGSDVSNPEVFYKLQLPFKSVFHDSIVVSDDKEKKVFNEDLKNEMVKKLISKYSLENNHTPLATMMSSLVLSKTMLTLSLLLVLCQEIRAQSFLDWRMARPILLEEYCTPPIGAMFGQMSQE